MNKVKINAKPIQPNRIGQGTLYQRQDMGDENFVVMLSGWTGSVQAIDLQDGIPWFCGGFETVDDVHKALLDDGFSLLPTGSSVTVTVNLC